MVTLLIIYLTLSVIAGAFSVSQMQYQDRIGGFTEFLRGIFVFIKGLLFWPLLLPLGIKKKKYKFNVYHKITSRKVNI